MSHEGSGLKVLASGTTPGQRSVAWVAPESATQLAFIEALEEAFSSGIQAAAVRALGLGPAPGKALASLAVEQTSAMAETSQNAMLGVDFMTQLTHSAAAHSPGFAAACEALGLSAAEVSAQQREMIDLAMQQRFTLAASQGQSPVPAELAQQWLRSELMTQASGKV